MIQKLETAIMYEVGHLNENKFHECFI